MRGAPRISRFKATCADKGVSYGDVAKGSGVSFSTVGLAGRGMVPGPACREKIAAFLGLDPDSIWPLAQDAIARRASHG